MAIDPFTHMMVREVFRVTVKDEFREFFSNREDTPRAHSFLGVTDFPALNNENQLSTQL